MKRLIPAIALLCIFAAPSRAWNCRDPLAARVPVPAGTTGSFGDGDGQLFLGTGAEGVKGQLYECKVPTPKSKGGPIQKQSQTQSDSSNSTSNSNSNSSSNSSATGGNSSATGGSATSTGGSSAVKNSGNSTLTNSGNSSASEANNSSGNTSTYESNTTVDAAKIPVATALAVAPPATSPCVVGFGGGVQTMAFGGSISGGKIDKNCAILETARSFASMNSRLAYCKTMLTNKFAKKAGITLEDCMLVPAVTLAPAPIPAPVPTPQPIVIQVPAAALPAPPPAPVVQSTATLTDLGSFRVTRSYSTNLCPTVQVVLGPNGVQILNRAIALNGEVTLVGNVYTTAVATSYLRKHGVSKVIIRAADEQDNSVGVQVWSAQ